MDKLCFLIAAHARPKQFVRLAEALNYPHFDVFAHIDLKADQRLFHHPGVRFMENRLNCTWGDWSQLQMNIDLLKAAYQHNPHYKYYSLISGQDYPIKSNREIHSILSQNVKELIRCTSTPSEDWHYRYQHYHFMKKTLWHRVAKQAFRAFNRILPPREFPAGYTPCFGASWWTLTGPCVKFILDFIEREKAFCEFFRYIVCPDEMLFHTILFNSGYGPKTADYLRYIDWSECRPNPKILKYPDDYDGIRQSNALFARKFDMDADAVILDKIDELRKASE